MSFGDDWEDVEVPRGFYISWGNNPAKHVGQHVTGEVLEYEPEGGTTFNGEACPRVTIILTEPAASISKEGERTDFKADQLVMVNCGQASLRRAIKAAKLGVGDMARIKLDGFTKIDKGMLKDFKIQVKRGSGSLSANGERALASAAADPADSGAPKGDPWGSEPVPAAVGGGFGETAPGDDEPPF